MTSIKLHNIPSDATSIYEQVLREGRERLVLRSVEIDATSVVSSILVMNRSGRRVE